MNPELVDLSFVEKRRNDPRATHHPDVLPFFLPQTGCERFDGFAHELNAGRRRRWQGDQLVVSRRKFDTVSPFQPS